MKSVSCASVPPARVNSVIGTLTTSQSFSSPSGPRHKPRRSKVMPASSTMIPITWSTSMSVILLSTKLSLRTTQYNSCQTSSVGSSRRYSALSSSVDQCAAASSRSRTVHHARSTSACSTTSSARLRRARWAAKLDATASEPPPSLQVAAPVPRLQVPPLRLPARSGVSSRRVVPSPVS